MRRIISGLLFAALASPACAQNTQAQYLNQNNSQSPTAVALCPSATVDGVSANCEFVSGGPNTQAQYLNQNGSTSPAMVLVCPDPANPGYTIACDFSGGTVTVTGSPVSGQIAKFSGATSITNAVSGTDYAPATSGSSVLSGNGSGAFANVTIGSGLSFTGGTLSASGGGGNCTVSGSSGDLQMNSGSSGCAASALNDNGTIIKSTESIDTKTNATVWEIANESSTGTTVSKLAFLTGAPSTAKIQPTASQVGALGVVIGGAGTTGSAQIAITGQASCVFDGATTAGHYVDSSTGTAGDCHDAGSGEPNGVTVVGIVLSTNASAGTYGVSLFPPTENSISGSAGTAGKPCTSTNGAVQYVSTATTPGTFQCATLIVNSGVMDFTDLTNYTIQIGGQPFFSYPNFTGSSGSNIGIGEGALYSASTNYTGTTGNVAIGSTAGSAISLGSSYNTLIGNGAGYGIGGLGNTSHVTFLGPVVGFGTDTCTSGCAHDLVLGTDFNCALSADNTSNEFDLCAASGSTPLLKGSLNASTLSLKVNGTVAAAGYTVSTLPSGAPQAVAGAQAYVTDAVACTFLASLTGGGSTFCPVTYNGAAWIGG